MCIQMSEECVDINRSFVLLAGVRWGPTPKHLFIDFACPNPSSNLNVTGRKGIKRNAKRTESKWKSALKHLNNS